MATLQLGEAFSRYGATARNPVWSVSAWTAQGELVVSCWAHHFGRAVDGVLPYEDRLAGWSGPGADELRASLARALEERSPVRLIVATSQNTEEYGHGIPKTFHVRQDLIGHVELFDGDRFVLHFRRAA